MRFNSNLVFSLTSFAQTRPIYHNALRHFRTLRQTIFAHSSGQGKCGVAVIRVSGPDAKAALTALAGPRCQCRPRVAQLRSLKDPESEEVLDRAIVLWFPGPNSFTGEDSCEFQVHGGLAVISGVLTALGKIPGLRAADPGEFSKRAFYNGKIDLTEAEGLADLIHAETEMQRKQALLQMTGSLHDLYQSWRTTLLRCVAHVEAYIDFSEDDNIEGNVLNLVEDSIKMLCEEIKGHLADGRCGERLRSGVKAAIIGEPNVGKSSLLNTLCKRQAAIVTEIAGTTRDIVEQYINIGGYPLLLADTAGLRGRSETSDPVEVEGIARAVSFSQSADLILIVIDSTHFLKWLDGNKENMLDGFLRFLRIYGEKLQLNDFTADISSTVLKSATRVPSFQRGFLVALSKADLIPDENMKSMLYNFCRDLPNVQLLSCTTQEGLPLLRSKLQTTLQTLCGNPSHENPILSQVRHRQHLANSLLHLQSYLNETNSHTSSKENNSLIASGGPDLALCAEDLRRALYALGKLTGHVTTEQVLDVIFRDFCIGK